MEEAVGGYQCEFVDQVPEELVCKACRLVAREPHIVDCCSQHYCQVCIEQIIKDKKPCPNCNERDFDTLLIRGGRKKILAFNVYCTMRQKGCKWIDQLKLLDAHLHPANGDCLYTVTECPSGCGKRIQKNNLKIHLEEDCIKREYRCAFCNFKATFEIVSEKHWPECLYYPVRCPNNCGVTDERENMKDHKLTCPMEKVKCELSYAGCQQKFLRQAQDDHMEKNTQPHISLMASESLRLSQELKEHKEEFGQQLVEKDEVFQKMLQDQDESVKKQLKEKYDELSEKLDKISKLYEQQFKEKQVKEIAEHTFELKSKEIEEKLQAKLDEAIDKLQVGHRQEIEKLEAQLVDKDQQIQELNTELGTLQQEVRGNDDKFEQVIRKQNEDVETMQMDHKEIIEQKSEDIRVVKADVEKLQRNLKDSDDKIIEIGLKLEHPLVFTMYNFNREKAYKDWKSPPMYTHYQGYRFCIGVNANGFADGKGTHVSVGCAQMKGDYDPILPWPAKVTIKLELLNQHEDNSTNDHCEVTHWFAWTAPITSGTGGVFAFKNASKFISHEDLRLNADKRTHYLKENCLKFRVTTLDIFFAG